MNSPTTQQRGQTAPLVALIGGSGFVGRYVAQELARAGCRIRVISRRPNQAMALQTYGDVGQIALVQANIRDDASIARAVKGADIVVNLVGILTQVGRQTFDAVQAEGAARVAKAAAAAGASRFVQLSAIGSNAESESDYARTKAKGEAAVRAAMPGAVILRPSIIFGPEDQFFNRFAAMARFSPALPVVGAETRFQPVYVSDVAQAVAAAALGDEATVAGKTFELGGPRIYRFDELLEEMLKVIHRRRFLAKLPFFAARIQASMLDLIPYVSLGLASNTLLTVDQVKLLKNDNVVSEGALGLADLAVTSPSTVEAIIPSYLWRFRPHGQFAKAPSETV